MSPRNHPGPVLSVIKLLARFAELGPAAVLIPALTIRYSGRHAAFPGRSQPLVFHVADDPLTYQVAFTGVERMRRATSSGSSICTKCRALGRRNNSDDGKSS
jgi:hypothetical protein